MYKLYGGRFSRAIIVEMVLEEANLPYQLIELDLTKEEHRSPDFLAINPSGFVPALITPEGETLTETPAICLALAERHQLHYLVPAVEESQRDQFLSRLFLITGELEPAAKRYFFPHRYGARPEDTEQVARAAFRRIEEVLAIMDHDLAADGPFALGQRFSLLDLLLATWIVYFGGPDRFPNSTALRLCVEKAMARPVLAEKLGRLAVDLGVYLELKAEGKGVR